MLLYLEFNFLPFFVVVLPAASSMKRAALKMRHKFSADSLSDHMAYLRVFQAWQRARSEGYDRSFCEKNFVSSATMEMIHGMRFVNTLQALRCSKWQNLWVANNPIITVLYISSRLGKIGGSSPLTKLISSPQLLL